MKIRRSSIMKVLFIPCLSTFILAVFLLTFKVNGICASASSPKLPIYVENINVQPYQDWINSRYGGFWNLSQDFVIGWGSQENGYFVQTFAIPQVPSDISYYLSFSPNGIKYDYPDFDYTNNTLTLTFFNLANDNYRPWRLITFYTNGNNGPGSPYADAFNTANTINKGVYGNTGAVLNYVSSNIYLTDNGAWLVNQPVFVNELPPEDPNYDVPLTGHATPYDPLNIPTYTQGHTAPSNVPPTHNSYYYTWNTYNPPSIDTTDFVSTMESVGDIITYSYGYLKDNISNEFSNLIDNIVSTGNFIAQTIQYYGNLLVSGINNFIKNFYDNMVSLLEPITIPFLTILAMGTDPDSGFFSIPYLTKVLFVPSTDNIIDLIVANDDFHFITNAQELITMGLATIRTILNITPSAKIHVPSCYYHGQQIGNYDIDFSWFNNYKAYSDILVSGFLIFGYLYWLYITFSSHIRGIFMPDVTPEDDSYHRNNIGF